MSALSTPLSSKQIVVPAAFEDVGTLCDSRGRLANQPRLRCSMARVQIHGAYVHGKVLDVGIRSSFKLPISG